ncbi:uncharacterized protein C15orf39 homolog [Nothobranchius furzeri]|nr:uncharacterized protein C15orf39 homolog [Nothobranchius furzeri]KAF7224380.1 hypothetical protein G4P62_012707 [Nothobranchius furzeri]
MSRESMQTLTDPVFLNKMPFFDGTITSAGLSKPQTIPGFLGKQNPQYNGAYFTYEPWVTDSAAFTPPWSSSKTSPLDDRSPESHLSGMVVQNHMVYRKDGISAEDGQSHPASACHTPVKQGFVPYTKSPEINSPVVASSVVMRKPKTGGESSSSPSQSSVYIAIPKPVYRMNPCCNEVGCAMGQQYSVEHVSARIPNSVYEHDWVQSNGHYTEKPPAQRKDTLLKHKDLQFECHAEQLKRLNVEAYSPNRARTFPSVMEPNYSSFSCTPTHTLFGAIRDHRSQPLQTLPGGYAGLYAPHPAYEHMTSEVYQECSPMSKYGQLAQRPVFYYSQANGEVESRTQRKDSGSKQGEGTPLLHKHRVSSPREHYVVSRPHRAEIPLSCTEILPNHSFIREFEYPCYTLPRFHLSENHIQAPLERQHSLSAFHPSHSNMAQSSQHIDHPIAKDKASSSLHADRHHGSRVDQNSPSRRGNQSDLSPSSIQAGRFYQPFTGVHIDAPGVPSAGVIVDRVLDQSSCEAHVKQPKSLPVSPAAWLHQSPGHGSDRIHTAVPNNANVRKIIYSPVVTTGSKHNGLVSHAGTADYKKCLKRSTSPSFPPMKIKDEDEDSYEAECTNKRQRVEMENVKEWNKTDSPPMPVINSVFSLAFYQSQLQESGIKQPEEDPRVSEQRANELDQNTKEERPDQQDQQPVVSLVSKEISDPPADEAHFKVLKPTRIKLEKVDEDECEESHNDHNRVAIKAEPKETDSTEGEPVLLKEKHKSDEVENKLLHAGANATSGELRLADLMTQTNPSSEESTLHRQMATLHPNATTPLPLPVSEVSFKSIPPHCLKLSTYNIIVPNGKHCRTFPHPQEKPSPMPVTVVASKQDQPPVRKHFLELHQSLCNLVTKSVSASSERGLKNWLSELEITEHISQSEKVQKVSCLLGVKAREAWINEEVRSALCQVLERLREYTAHRHCPFPHVMRTGAVFLPMLVVKELLFPMVQSSFIDRVLQEHKVELRPTTLSEEKILIQLHKRACSSRLRRLMSLKHLPDIYAEAVNLLYYTCVCKHLGINVDSCVKEQDGSGEASDSSAAVLSDTASPALPSELSQHEKCTNDQETPNEGQLKRSLSLVDKNLSDEDEADGVEIVDEGSPTESNGDEIKENDHVAAELDFKVAPQDNSWTCPLTLDEFAPSDTENENFSSLTPDDQPVACQVQPKGCSSVILKLRKMLGGGLSRKKACYQAVSESGTVGETSVPQTDVEDVWSNSSLHRTPKLVRGWKGKGSFSRTLRPLRGPSKTKPRSLLKIKYCPYLSACHSAEHRRRWVLRSAVQTARRAMRLYYPDLVGKKIRHLYEEDDKSEVWYRGEVLRIHEAHSNPLKTIFEVRYDSEPEWKYYLELMIDYKKGWLKIED